jgi:hypothetical protein
MSLLSVPEAAIGCPLESRTCKWISPCLACPSSSELLANSQIQSRIHAGALRHFPMEIGENRLFGSVALMREMPA